MNPDFHHLHLMVGAEIARARKQCRGGKPETAIRIFRFIEQGQMLQLLSKNGYETASLFKEFKSLEREIHPLYIPENKTDLEKIYGELIEIRGLISQNFVNQFLKHSEILNALSPASAREEN